MIEYLNSLCGVSIELDELAGREDLLKGKINCANCRSVIGNYSLPQLEVFSLIDGFEEFVSKDYGKQVIKLWKIYSNGDPQLDEIYSLLRVIWLFK